MQDLNPRLIREEKELRASFLQSLSDKDIDKSAMVLKYLSKDHVYWTIYISIIVDSDAQNHSHIVHEVLIRSLKVAGL